MKVIVDRDLDTPPESRILDQGRCVFFTGPSPDEGRVNTLTERGAKVIKQNCELCDHIPMEHLLEELAALGVNQLMVEGGSRLISSLIRSGVVDEYSLFIAPKVLGEGLCFSDRIEFKHVDDAISMKQVKIRRIGDDIWFEGVPSCSPDL